MLICTPMFSGQHQLYFAPSGRKARMAKLSPFHYRSKHYEKQETSPYVVRLLGLLEWLLQRGGWNRIRYQRQPRLESTLLWDRSWFEERSIFSLRQVSRWG